MSDLNLVRSKPVANFFYKGTHSHFVRRTVLVTEQSKETIKGYEVREGTLIRDIDDAPIKTFRLDKVAKTNQLRKDNAAYDNRAKSTYERLSLTEMVI